MKQLISFAALAIVLASCAPTQDVSSAANAPDLELESSTLRDQPVEEAAKPFELQSVEPTEATVPTPEPEIIYNYPVEIPRQLDSREPMRDFTATMMGGWTFSLSAQQGSYTLVYPTIIGCGDCLFTLNQLATAYPEYRDFLQVVVLDILADDQPEDWRSLANFYEDLAFEWGVVDSAVFVIDYEILGLGTTMLFDPEGRLAFRHDLPLNVEEFRQLFELVKEESENR